MRRRNAAWNKTFTNNEQGRPTSVERPRLLRGASADEARYCAAGWRVRRKVPV
jgi:hypothetical protein